MRSHWDCAALKWTKSSNYFVLELHWPSLASRRVFWMCLYVFQILHRQVISGLGKYFVPSSSNTRSHKMSFQTVSSTLNSYRYSFVVSSIILWNKHPLHLVSFDLFSIFKKALHKWLFFKYSFIVLYYVCMFVLYLMYACVACIVVK